jgi:hypothetical protein
MDAALNGFERDPDAKIEDIDAAIVTFGKEIWPYKEAYEAFYRSHGEERERALLREKLSEPARAIFDKFIAEGGRVEDVRGGAKFESFFDTDLRAQIVDAELAAHDGVHEEMERLLAGEMKEEFAALLAEHRTKLAGIVEKIGNLRQLAARSPKWAPEILDKAKTFEQGFAYVERTPTADDVQREIQYYIDIME